MSKNRRYGTDGSRAAINEFLTRPAPVTLTPEEIGPWPVVEPPGEAVDVWLRFVEIRVQERAVALAYTDRAVQVEVTLRSGSTCRTAHIKTHRRVDPMDLHLRLTQPVAASHAHGPSSGSDKRVRLKRRALP